MGNVENLGMKKLEQELGIVRSIDLNPEDWLWATWRDRNFLPMPEVKPFDKEEALAKLQQIFIEKHGSRLSE
ncbi:MAG: hypothetical protein AAF383_03915, partial [Cyanobacteria bacterium P01_A01_bin.83]